MQAVIKVYPYKYKGPWLCVCVGGGGGFPSQGYIFLSKSLAEGVFFLRKPLKIGILGLYYQLFFFYFLFTREYLS